MIQPLSPLHATLRNVSRVCDAARLNAIVNHPSVLPWVCGDIEGPLDLSPVVADPRNVTLIGAHGGVLFHYLQPGLYEAHTQVLPAGRGRWALDFVNACLHWLFTRTDAGEVMTKCPKGNLAAKALARAIHGTFEFTNPNGWIKDGKIIPADIYSLSIEGWARHASGLVERGGWFHDRLEAEFTRHAIQEPLHADDQTHDRYVGATCEMLLGGQIAKGVAFYNRWARLAGYEPVDVVSVNPPIVDIKTSVLCIDEHDFHLQPAEISACL